MVAQQIHTIQHAVAHNIKQFMFEGVELTLNPSCSIFITMNTTVGYDDREVVMVMALSCDLCLYLADVHCLSSTRTKPIFHVSKPEQESLRG